MYSIVIPCYNSSKTINLVVEQTMNELSKLNITEYEFILVNDCSPDGGKTYQSLKELSNKYECVTVVDLAKNFGQHNASMAGLNYARGDIIISMDDDMQTHPSQIKFLLEEFDKGYDIVYGYYPKKKHNILRNIWSYLNYLSVRILIGKPKDLKTSSFWIIRKYVRDYVIQYKRKNVYLQGLFLRVTNNISCVPIQHFEREIGKSNYNFKKLLGVWSNILGFSSVPLKLAIYLGVLFSLTGFVGTLVIIIKKLLDPATIVGWASIMTSIFFMSGVILLSLGIVGAYIGRITMGINAEPQYVVREKCGTSLRENEECTQEKGNQSKQKVSDNFGV